MFFVSASLSLLLVIYVTTVPGGIHGERLSVAEKAEAVRHAYLSMLFFALPTVMNCGSMFIDCNLDDILHILKTGRNPKKNFNCTIHADGKAGAMNVIIDFTAL